jgi:hypothetical protein
MTQNNPPDSIDNPTDKDKCLSKPEPVKNEDNTASDPVNAKEKNTPVKKVVSKIRVQDVYTAMASAVNKSADFELRFPEVVLNDEFPTRYHVEMSQEGQRSILREYRHHVCRYVDMDMLAAELATFAGNLALTTGVDGYWCDYDKAKKAAAYWKATTRPHSFRIAPVLQRSTPGYTFHRLDFDMDESDTPTFDYLIDSLDTNQKAFIGYLGALFDPTVTLQQYLWITGSGGDGKGALFRLLARIFDQSYTSIATDYRFIDKFWASGLIGKRVAVSADTTNTAFINTSTFKSLTGGDHVSVRKMRREEFTVKLNAMFIFGANMDPALTTEDSGLRRAIICRMDKDKYRYIENFEQKLWDERAGIVFKCTEQWKKFKEKSLHIPVDEESHRNLGTATEEMHQQLVDEYFVTGEGLSITASELIRELKEEKRPLSNNELGEWKRFLERVHGVKSKRRMFGNVKKMVYEGIGLKDRAPGEDDRF